jgi:hypothetical protein
LVQGPTPDYIHRELFWDRRRTVYSEQPIGSRLYPDGFAKLDLKPGAEAGGVHVTLQRGLALEGRLVGPQGQPVERARMLCRLNVTPASHGWRGSVELQGGRFCLRGCDPLANYPALFLDTEHQWGATVTVSGKPAGNEPVTVRLTPCGSAKARLVDTSGNPVKNFPPLNANGA